MSGAAATMTTVPARRIAANLRAIFSARARTLSSARAPSATSDVLAAKKSMLKLLTIMYGMKK